jgi:protein SCO1/2
MEGIPMNCQPPSDPRRLSNRLSPLSIFVGLLLGTLLLVAGRAAPVNAEPPGDRIVESDHRDHGSAPSAENTHVHPVADPRAAEETGLKERLGETIPLDLSFRDEEGHPVLLKDLITGPTIIAPVYFHCPNVCNFLQVDMARALPQVKLQPDQDYRVLSISFDDRETSSAARAARKTYLTAMGGAYPPNGWRFLTGETQAIRALTDAAGYHFLRQGDDFIHPVAIFVVSREGRIVRYLHGTRLLPMDLTLALTEAEEGRVGTTIRKMASFCFSFDPEKKQYVFNYLRLAATAVLLTAVGFLAFLVVSSRKN